MPKWDVLRRMRIDSPKNSLLQEVRKAAASGRRTEGGLIAAEGPHLLEEALRGTWPIEQVLITEQSRLRFSQLLTAVGGSVTEVSERAFAATCTTQTHQGVITLLRPRVCFWADLTYGEGPLVVLDGIQDPGNAGTIIRSAEAFGASGVVLLCGSVHVANGKLLRASAGSVFRVPFLENVTPDDLLDKMRNRGMSLYALSPDGRESISEVELSGLAALVIGSEGAGISPQLEGVSTVVRIPVEEVESLNAGIAASIALFEAARQRRRG